MSWSSITLETESRVALLTLSRPHRANTLTAVMLDELYAAQVHVEQDDQVRVLVVTGAGRHFCGGRDLGDAGQPAPAAGLGFGVVTKPVIAAINGAAYGGGCELALACDFRFMSSSARIALPEVKFGELPAGGATARLARVVGLSQAKRLIMTGADLSGEEAARIGLVDEAVPPGELRAAAMRFAALLAERAPYALRAAKLLLDHAVDTDLATALAFEKQVTRTMATTQEREEARAEAARANATYARIFGTGAR